MCGRGGADLKVVGMDTAGGGEGAHVERACVNLIDEAEIEWPDKEHRQWIMSAWRVW